MKPVFTLLENENILFEAQPKTALASYLLIHKGLRFLLVLIMFLLVFGVQAYQHEFFRSFLTLPVFFYGFIIVIAVPFLISYIWLRAAVSRHYFIFTNQCCILYSGFFGVNKRLIPYQRIVDVDFSQGPLESIFNIASVNIAEQSSNSLAISSQSSQGLSSYFSLNPSAVLGLSYEDADKLTHLISEHITKKN